MLIIGEIIKAQGISGELKIKPATNDVLRFKKLKAVYIDAVLYQISDIRIYNGFVFIKFAMIDTRDKAEAFVGKLICIDRVHAVATDEDEYFIADLLGCDFFVDEKREGRISNIHQNGAADVFEILMDNGKTIMFPFLKKLNLKVDAASSKVSVLGSDLWPVAIIN